VIDLSDNKIDDENVLSEIFEKLPNIAVLYLHGNPFVNKVSNYRKKFIYTLKNLKYLVNFLLFKFLKIDFLRMTVLSLKTNEDIVKFFL